MKPKESCHLLKVREPGDFPVAGEVRTFVVNAVKAENPDLTSETSDNRRIYLFHNDFPKDVPNGQLYARGRILNCSTESVEVEFDGVTIKVPLTTRSLDFFVPARVAAISEQRNEILYDLSVVRRKTTQSDSSADAAIYTVPGDCGAWLDIYHFQG